MSTKSKSSVLTQDEGWQMGYFVGDGNILCYDFSVGLMGV